MYGDDIDHLHVHALNNGGNHKYIFTQIKMKIHKVAASLIVFRPEYQARGLLVGCGIHVK